ncbi:hypothetical protein EV11_1444 [Prochlorococcus sp. SS52]|nr:hypothetical protein EV11_1444 [Prochlorococcus sp. SS52]
MALGGSISNVIPTYILQITASIGFFIIGLSLLISTKETT